MSKAKIDNLTKEIEKLNRIINEKDSFKNNMDDLMNKIKKLEQDMKEKQERYTIQINTLKEDKNNLLLHINNQTKENKEESKIINKKTEQKNNNNISNINEEKYEDTDKIYLDIKNKLLSSYSVSEEESVYLCFIINIGIYAEIKVLKIIL